MVYIRKNWSHASGIIESMRFLAATAWNWGVMEINSFWETSHYQANVWKIDGYSWISWNFYQRFFLSSRSWLSKLHQKTPLER